MGLYKILVGKRVRKQDLPALQAKDRRKVAARIARLAADPRPHGVEKLTDGSGYRVRQGSYRIVYEIDDRGETVTIGRIGHRQDVYK